jgi:hypothetical protein
MGAKIQFAFNTQSHYLSRKSSSAVRSNPVLKSTSYRPITLLRIKSNLIVASLNSNYSLIPSKQKYLGFKNLGIP